MVHTIFNVKYDPSECLDCEAMRPRPHPGRRRPPGPLAPVDAALALALEAPRLCGAGRPSAAPLPPAVRGCRAAATGRAAEALIGTV